MSARIGFTVTGVNPQDVAAIRRIHDGVMQSREMQGSTSIQVTEPHTHVRVETRMIDPEGNFPFYRGGCSCGKWMGDRIPSA